MTVEINELLDRYAKWLRDRTVLKQLDGWVEITTPYLDRHNDYLQVYARRTGEEILLTDDGHTIEDLEQSGCSLSTPKRKELLRFTLNGFGVDLKDNALMVRASLQDFPLKKHNLIQSMLAVNDLFFLSSPSVASLFLEDVAAWLDRGEIRFTANVKFSGKSGYDHHFDFVIPRSRRQPERILRAFNKPTRQSVESMAFSWLDTRETRAHESMAYAILNDTEKKGAGVIEGVSDALSSYGIRPIPWSHRDSFRDELAA